MTSIISSLGAGSGIDTQALIDSLSKAVKEPKEAAIAKREAANQASISSLGEISNAIDSFASALNSLIAGGTLYTQPSVSDATVLSATAAAGASIGGLASQIRVEQLAQAQSLVSTGLANSTAAVGEGTLTLTVGTTNYDVTITSANNTLAGLAKAINDKGAGVTASIVTDQGVSKLVLRGSSGTEKAFSLSVPNGTASGLERFAYGTGVTGGMTLAQEAKDAIVVLDGVEVRRGSNSFSDLIDGVQFDLKKAAPGQVINLGATRPTAAITQAVGDFVAAYNELHSMLDEATAAQTKPGEGGGPLRADLSVRELKRQLSGLTSKVLNSAGGPSTLAEIGVATNRDGTLSVNSVRLQAALAADPDGVEKLFNPGQSSDSPLLTIGSKLGKVKPGVYTITDVVPAADGGVASGKVDGVAMIGTSNGLVAPAGSAALGLILKVSGPVTSAKITVDFGLGGALQSIRDSIRARSGPIASAQERLQKEATAIAKDRETMETRYDAYYNQLVTSFTKMESRVSAFKATQSYLQQQIDAWNSGD